MSDIKKADKIDEKKEESANVVDATTTITKPTKPADGEWTAAEVAALAEAQAKKAAEKAAKAKAIVDAKDQEEYEAAAKEASATTVADKFTNKRAGEQIFRREMEEPEFWLTKEGLVPPRPVLSKEEEDAITKRVEIPTDQIPDYKPEHILSPEYNGMSHYEIGIDSYAKDLKAALARLKADPDSSENEIRRAEKDLAKMDCLYENFSIGMNVFRTAKGGRDKIKK